MDRIMLVLTASGRVWEGACLDRNASDDQIFSRAQELLKTTNRNQTACVLVSKVDRSGMHKIMYQVTRNESGQLRRVRVENELSTSPFPPQRTR